MRKVRSNHNQSTEIRLIAFFKANHIVGWRRKFPLAGKPDFVFPKRRVVVFADGCFWHGHNCRRNKPETNREYWENKIAKNILRDSVITKILEDSDGRFYAFGNVN